jgi:hypothetical protein
MAAGREKSAEVMTGTYGARKHRLVVVFPCEWWEREAGADRKEESPRGGGLHVSNFGRTDLT